MHLTLRILPKNREKVIHSAHSLVVGGVAAAYFAPHPAGWFFYPLGNATPPAWVNCQPCPEGKVLVVGDVLRIGSREMIVDSWDLSDLEPVLPETVHSSCQINLSGGFADERQIDRPLLIGTAAHCDLIVPPSSGLEPLHLLIARIEGRWLLFDLSGQRIAREDEISCLYLYLTDGDIVRVGQIVFSFWVIPDRASGSFLRPHSSSDSVDLDSLRGGVAEVGMDVTAEVQIQPDLTDEVQVQVQVQLVDAIFNRCIRLARDIQQSLAGQPQTQPVSPGSIRKRFNGILGVAESADDAIDRYSRLFRKNPSDRQSLMEFVRFVETQAEVRHNPEFLDLARIVCKELVHLAPGDGDSLMMLIRIYIAQGRIVSRSYEQRLMDYDKAAARLDRLLPSAVGRPELVEIQQIIAAEKTILLSRTAPRTQP